jgi:hypothetical protein
MAIKCRKGTPCGGACIRTGAKCNKEFKPGQSEALDKVKKKIGLGVKIRNAQRKGQATEEARLRLERAALSNRGNQPNDIQAKVEAARAKGRAQAEKEIAEKGVEGAMRGMVKKEAAPDLGSIPKKPDELWGAWDDAGLKKQQQFLKDRGMPPDPRMEGEIRRREAEKNASPAKPNTLENWGTAQLVAKRGAAWRLGMDDRVARFDAELDRRGWKAPEPSAPTQASADTKSSRKSAKKFDEEMKTEQLRRDGDQTFDRWDETTGSGSKKIGQGAFGSVTVDKDRTYAVKRGDISDTEGKLIQKIGDRDLGPKLIAADVDGPGWERAPGVDNRRGRLAMTIVDGEPIGIYRRPDDMIGGVRVADAYWTARAQLHRMGIAHNDMHIDNVLVDGKGKGRFVDMGLAQDSPKAALAEAMGAFSPPRGGQADRTGAGGAGQGDWQVRRYSGTGGELLGAAQRTGDRTELEQRAPVAARVLDNKNALQFRMLKDGYSKDDIATVMDHGLRSDPSSYNKGIWQRITDQQAQEYINILYDGV